MSNLKKAENFVYFNPNTCSILEHQHYDIGIELQSTCTGLPVGTMGIMIPNEEFLLRIALRIGKIFYILSAVRLIKSFCMLALKEDILGYKISNILSYPTALRRSMFLYF